MQNRFGSESASAILDAVRVARDTEVVVAEPDPPPRPRTVGDCRARGLGRVRPCGYVACGYHLALDVHTKRGSIRFNFPSRPAADGVPEIDVAAMGATCAIAVAEGGERTLEEIGGMMGLTRERVRQLESRAQRLVRFTSAAAGDLVPLRTPRR